MNKPLRHFGAMKRGFTLVELLVVLLILVILAGIAVQSLEGVEDQTRYQATQRGMQNIEDALIGPAGQISLDGSPLVTGFVADNGRLPLAVGADPLLQAQELWSNPRGLNPFGLIQVGTDSEIRVPCGWRGEYLRLGAGVSSLTDGWGNPYDLLQADRATKVADGQPIEVLRSLGSDGQLDTATTSDYTTDIYIPFNSSAAPALDRYHAGISGNVFASDGTSNPAVGSPVKITYFGPNPSGTGGVLELTQTGPGTITGGGPLVSGIVTLTVTVDATTNATTYSVINATIGPRTVRAYQGTTLKSAPGRIMLMPGGGIKDLILR